MLTMGNKKRPGTPLTEDLERSRMSMGIQHREGDVWAIGTGAGAHKQSLAQGGDYKEDREASKVEEVRESTWWA